MASYKPVTHVIFDLDGTLIGTEEIFEKIYQGMANKYGKTMTWELRQRCMGRPAYDALSIMISELGLPLTVEQYDTIAKQTFSDSVQKELLNCKLKPGARRLVEHLNKNQIPIAIATSSKKESFVIKTKNHQDLLRKFSHQVLAPNDPDVKRGKPAPDIFLVCAERFKDKPNPEEVLVFEDSPSGVRAAVAAGMQVVMVPDTRINPELCKGATLVLETMEEFQPELFGLPAFLE
ncbi:pseudouridine-5'-phosphatase [Caerostris darwini]|uniref:pseudouridine 5'-phosphatase n=1 Tax=Caerostris darwini TaxID=1538125 RepID=A0AAV4WEN8_9ARAC|nr:pseudouridine-5'-phosphatase [Caerostris darwini]